MGNSTRSNKYFLNLMKTNLTTFKFQVISLKDPNFKLANYCIYEQIIISKLQGPNLVIKSS